MMTVTSKSGFEEPQGSLSSSIGTNHLKLRGVQIVRALTDWAMTPIING